MDFILTVRETEVARLVSEELCDKQIADALQISINTVKNHLRNIREKTNTKTKIGIAVFYITKINL